MKHCIFRILYAIKEFIFGVRMHRYACKYCRNCAKHGCEGENIIIKDGKPQCTHFTAKEAECHNDTKSA